MKLAKLLSKLDSLSFPERQRTLTAVARETSPLRPLLDSLHEDLYQAHCALTMAAAARDSEFLLGAFGWNWPQARKRAASLLVDQPGVPKGLVEATLLLDMTARQTFLRKIRRARREDLAELLIGPLRERFGPKEACLLLPALSPEQFDAWLPGLAYRLQSWRTPAGRFPDRILAYMRTELERHGAKWRTEVWYRFSSAIGILAQKRPEALLKLVTDLGVPKTAWSLLGPALGLLATRQPRALVDLLLQDEYRALWKHQGLPTGVLGRLRYFNFETRLALLEPLAGSEHQLERALRRVAPSHREALFEGATARLDISQQQWNDNLMKTLPHPLRAREAERMLTLASVKSSLEATVSRLGQLPPDRAKERLSELVRNPKVETRARVREAMVVSAGLYRTAVEEALVDLKSLKNEADPVRLAALQALSHWPYSCIEEAHIRHLRPVLGDVCEARDTSEATRSAFRRMALKWLELAEAGGALFCFGLEVLQALSDASPAIYLSSIRNFSEERREAIITALMPRVDKEIKGENFHPLFSLCSALGDRLYNHPSVEKRLEILTRNKQEWDARRAIDYWLSHPKKKGERAAELLRRDASAIAVHSVLQVVNRQRQDLLDPHLRKKRVKGRFLTGDTIYVLPVFHGFHRWLPRQQSAFAQVHALVFNDQNKTVSSRASSIRLMKELCFVSDQPIAPLLKHPELALREAALGAINDPEVLLSHLNSQEARVAAYRLGTVVRDSRPDEASTIVNQGLCRPTKLTSKKELYRLLGLLREFEPLAAAWREEGQHRDLLVAVLHAVQEMLDLTAARQLFLQAFEVEDQWLVRAALAAPRIRVPEEHRKSWVKHLQKLVEHSEPTLSILVWSTLRSWAMEAPELSARTAVQGVSDLDSIGWRQAVELLLSCAELEGNLAEAAGRLIQQDSVTKDQRDLPARQRLRHLVNRACAEDDAGIRGRMMQELAGVDLPESWLRFTVRAASESWAEMAKEVETFEEMEALITAVKTEVARPAWEPSRVLESARVLACDESRVSRRLAVELLALAGARMRWNQPCRELLGQLREDGYRGVAERAALLVTRPEP